MQIVGRGQGLRCREVTRLGRGMVFAEVVESDWRVTSWSHCYRESVIVILLSGTNSVRFPPNIRILTPNLQGYLAHKKVPPPPDHRRALGIVLLYGPRRKQFFMSEVPL